MWFVAGDDGGDVIARQGKGWMSAAGESTRRNRCRKPAGASSAKTCATLLQASGHCPLSHNGGRAFDGEWSYAGHEKDTGQACACPVSRTARNPEGAEV